MKNLITVTKPTPKAKAAETALLAELDAHPFDIDEPIIVAIGGDGTMLHAIREHLDDSALFVGISAGRLGFLQTVEPEQIPEFVEALRQRSYSTNAAPLLVAHAADGSVLGHAFNDISIERASSRAAKFNLHIGEADGNFIGDGVIFSTPLGSTAYALAAGGPIIDSRTLDVFVVTPNNPHISSLYSSLQRPHVLHRQRRVRISLSGEDIDERPIQVVVDGQIVTDHLKQGVEITLDTQSVKLLQLKPDGFHDRIAAKRLGRH